MTSRQTSSRLDLTYAPSTITTQQPTEREFDLLFEAMYDYYIGGQPSATPRTHQPATNADTVPNAMFDDTTFVNPFATPSISATESSSSQYVDPSKMHLFYQTLPNDINGTKDHTLESSDRRNSRQIMLDEENTVIQNRLSSYERVPPRAEEYGLSKKPSLWGTVNMVLWYTKDSGFELTEFLDADYAGCKDTFKSTLLVVTKSLDADTVYGYGFLLQQDPIYYDSNSAIVIS
ncbi:hypothetical protein Tco_0685155 [Tanacetum coccineum]